MIEVESRDDMTPVCPHCNTGISKLFVKQIRTTFGRRYIYFCSQCSKTLGISHRKGFWMG